MIAVLAPAKTMDFKSKTDIGPSMTEKPDFPDETFRITEILRSMDKEKISKLMKISPKITDEVYNNLSDFSFGRKKERLRPAAFAYTGETFKGFSPSNFTKDDLKFAREHVRILSALYGIITPLTLIEPYRLEMGLTVKALYNGRISAFWKDKVTEKLNSLLSDKKEKTIVNLASSEYIASIDRKNLNGNILEVTFKQQTGSKLKTVGTFSKKARGMMASFIVKERIDEPLRLKEFIDDGYLFSEELSEENEFVFVRKV